MTDLYELLPRVHRLRDELGDGRLRLLLEVIGEQLGVLEESLDQFYDDLFVETAADWAVPYIGDLVGHRPLYGGPPTVGSPRAEVANTIAYRRRKGTAAMLEQLAFDVTGWRARAVEFFERLATTQHMNHPRPDRGGTPDVRRRTLPGAFDERAHLAEVRRVSTGAGRYNIHNIGLFLWRLDAVEVFRSPLVPDAGSRRRFRFHPLGIDQRLFGKPRTEEGITHLAEPFDVPLPLTRRFLADHRDVYYGHGRSLLVELVGAATPSKVRVCDLSDVADDWAHAPQPGSDVLAVDPVLGRVYFPEAVPAGVIPVGTFHQGYAMRVGGGGYDREASTTPGQVRQVSGGAAIQPHLDSVTSGGTVHIADSWLYGETPAFATAAGRTVLLRGAHRRRPHLAAAGPVAIRPGPGGTVVLDGLLISGDRLTFEDGGDLETRTLVLRHCTLVPGLTRTAGNEPTHPVAPSLVVSQQPAQVIIDRCVLGPVEVADGVEVSIRDSVLDSYRGGSLTLAESTVLGTVTATRIDISNSIVLGAVTARRRQEGCLRFSRVAESSLTPSRHRCTTVPPAFTSVRFGDPGYAQLRSFTPDEVRRGADNESEMGAGNHLFAPQREANLRLRLDEYLRFGLEAGIFHAT
ncbi:hypothetical protein [Spongiactinospora sp. TRM90649]|uniref:hypothetical protein n=1 Tax=Spongiactinospora sp. TRM90649 TaxID=3031114 RepID=UPI0023F85BF6|nr:hypothetical protein [Spongiactinospora sp. TRM90649]MDF5753131.1 hypothetical protein [Spongiactinospora sp. TRM90649]